MKILRKDQIAQRNQKIHTKNERDILENVKHPFIVQLIFAFQSDTKLYLITDFMIGGIYFIITQSGELFFHLRRSFKFQEERAKLYTAELVLALEYLHC
jgi:serine/threonine protein kinase